MSEFKVGDRVRYAGAPDCGGSLKRGMEGKVITLGQSFIGVEWDDNIGGHSGTDVDGKNGHCWNVAKVDVVHSAQ